MVLLGMGRALEPGSWLPANMLAETSTLGQGNLIPHTIGNDVGPVPKMAMMSIKVLGGMVTFGDQPPPIDLYKGPTSRQKVKEPDTLNTSGEGEMRFTNLKIDYWLR